MFQAPQSTTLATLWSASKEQLIKEALSILGPIVGKLTVVRTDGSEVMGSAFLYSSSPYLITCRHVVEKAVSVSVEFLDGGKLNAIVVAESPNRDLAVIRLNYSDTLGY